LKFELGLMVEQSSCRNQMRSFIVVFCNSMIVSIALPYRKSITGGFCTALAKLKTG